MRDRKRFILPALLLLLLLLWGGLGDETTVPTALSEPVVIPAVQAPEPVEAACEQHTDGPVLGLAGEPQDTQGEEEEPWPPRTDVRCPLPAWVAELAPTGSVFVPLAEGNQYVEPRYDGVDALVPAFDGMSGGTFYLVGFAAFPFTVAGGICQVGYVEAKATVSGVIVPVAGAAAGDVVVQGCGTNEVVDADGGFYAEIDPQPCELFAVRRDGGIQVRSAVVALSPSPGEDILVDLVLPAWFAADAGVRIQEVDGGFVVSEAASGLLVGDVVLAVDGRSLDGASLWEVRDLETGPEGSRVVYTVERDGQVREIEAPRAAAER
jgi:hypothetical protein